MFHALQYDILYNFQKLYRSYEENTNLLLFFDRFICPLLEFSDFEPEIRIITS